MRRSGAVSFPLKAWPRVTKSVKDSIRNMSSLAPNLRYALRGIRRAPLFTSVAILSLALGIGANTAIFTLMDQLMLRKLPIASPEKLVMLVQHGSHNGSNMGPRMHSYPVYQDFQQRGEPFSEVCAAD